MVSKNSRNNSFFRRDMHLLAKFGQKGHSKPPKCISQRENKILQRFLLRRNWHEYTQEVCNTGLSHISVVVQIKFRGQLGGCHGGLLFFLCRGTKKWRARALQTGMAGTVILLMGVLPGRYFLPTQGQKYIRQHNSKTDLLDISIIFKPTHFLEK